MRDREQTFEASQFTPTRWDTAQAKRWFAKQFVRFVQSDFAARHFTKRFYHRLSMTFGHIAHYNQGGFWEHFFTTTADKVRFLEQTHEHPCGGDPAWTYSDVERELKAWLRLEETLERYRRKLTDETESTERAQLARLREKYGPNQPLPATEGATPCR
jgi:hypothetical protein